MGADPKKKRDLLVKARIYRFMAVIFAFAGLLVFTALFLRNIEGATLSSLTDPFVITMIIFPFLPAAVLSFLAGKMEREFYKTHDKNKK